MKQAGVFVFVLILCGMLLAQAPATPPAASFEHHDHHASSGPAVEHMQMAKDHLAKMRSTVEQMKANQAALKDPAAKKQAQMNIELWDGMVQHMEAMVNMMSEHHGQGMMGMHHGEMAEMHHEGMGGGMSCCAGMKDGGGCCGGMKDGGGGCCGGGKCMQGSGTKTDAPSNVEKNDK